jgi:RNA polymerase sigma factor (TIGR02999 family)
MSATSSDLSQLLAAAGRGDSNAAQHVFSAIYEELRRMAAGQMAREAPGHTLQPTALVHEAWLRLGGDIQGWNSRAHFFGAAAEAMRRILVESARRKRAVRHGGGLERINIQDAEIAVEGSDNEILAVHEALDRLAAHDARKAQLVKLRYFVGLSLEEAAKILGIAPTTAGRDWIYARAWLHQEIRGDQRPQREG